ncbi:cytosine permease [Xanthomonas bundabergensis]|uniref:cytosine permease n=1 Tax=Xanthomonas bundabergensis TaxID=3160842 RepID=UPI003513FA88
MSESPRSTLPDDHIASPVPATERRSFLGLMFTTSSWILSMSSMWTGSLLGQGMPLPRALLAIVLGMAILAGYGGLQGWLGGRYGVSTVVLAREAFGSAGARLLGGVLALTLGIGWFGWQLAFFADTLHAMFPAAAWASVTAASLWGGALMIVTALFGYRALASLSVVALPLKAGLVLWGLSLAARHAGAGGGIAHPPLALFEGVALVVGNAAIGAVIFPDLTRYARSPLQGALASASGYFLGGLVSLSAGAMFVQVAGAAGGTLPAAMAAAGMGTAGFLILLFAQWTTNTSNLYSGTLGLAGVLRLPSALSCIGMGVLGICIALSGDQQRFVPFLTALGHYVPPIAGVMLADHWIGKRLLRGRAYRVDADAPVARIGWGALATVLLAGGLASQWHWGIAPLNAVVLGFVLQAGLQVLQVRQEGKVLASSTGNPDPSEGQ